MILIIQNAKTGKVECKFNSDHIPAVGNEIRVLFGSSVIYSFLVSKVIRNVSFNKEIERSEGVNDPTLRSLDHETILECVLLDWQELNFSMVR